MTNNVTNVAIQNDPTYLFIQWLGLDLIFKVLCLMCKIMIYRLPIRDNIDKTWVNRFEDELNEIMREWND